MNTIYRNMTTHTTTAWQAEAGTGCLYTVVVIGRTMKKHGGGL